jgi:hypothetical protein
VSAIVVVAIAEGLPGLARLGRRVIRWRVNWIWYVAAISLPMLVCAVAIGLNVAAGASPPSLDQFRPWYAVLLVFGDGSFGYVLTAAEVEMLGQACRTCDELDRLEKAVRSLPELTVQGSMGQPKSHPLLAEVRAHRLLLERLTTALCLPDEDQEVGLRPGQRHARTAAQGRWRDHVPNARLAELRGEAS